MGRRILEFQAADTQSSEMRKKYNSTLEMFSDFVPQLISTLCYGSNIQHGLEKPMDLAIEAADFTLYLTVALAKNDQLELRLGEVLGELIFLVKKIMLWSRESCSGERVVDERSRERRSVTWGVEKWSMNSRSLYLKGSKRILEWLEQMKQDYDDNQDAKFKTGSLLLSPRWKHYGFLLDLENYEFSRNYKELLKQYLSNIEFYAEDQTENKDDKVNCFLNCLLLLLGHLTDEQLVGVISKYGRRMSQALMPQFQSADEDVVNGSIILYKAVSQMDKLLNHLNKRDAASKAFVNAVAECCLIYSDDESLTKLLKQIGFDTISQKRKVLDVAAHLIDISYISADRLSQSTWGEVANYLLGCLEDVDQIVRDCAGRLIVVFAPSLVLPPLVALSYSKNKTLLLSANSVLLALLTKQQRDDEILSMLLDSLSNLGSVVATGGVEGPASDDLKVLSEWAKIIVKPHTSAACIQVLFNVAYNLKTFTLQHADDILDFALKSLKEGSEEGKVLTTKHLASLVSRKGKEPKNTIRILLGSADSSDRTRELLTMEPEISSVFVQFLISVACDCQPCGFPYSVDLQGDALISLKEGFRRGYIVGHKLVASLIESEKEVVGSIFSRLLEARTLLKQLFLEDPSSYLGKSCGELLNIIYAHSFEDTSRYGIDEPEELDNNIEDSSIIRNAEVCHYGYARTRNQFRCNCCVAITVCAMLRTYFQLQYPGLDFEPAIQELIDFAFDPRASADRMGCRLSTFCIALEYLMKYGIGEERSYPYLGRKGPCRQPHGKRVKIEGYDETYGDTSLVDRWLADVTVVAGIRATHALIRWVDPRGQLIYPEEQALPSCGVNHAVHLIGRGTSSDGVEYYIIQNSWGVIWGYFGHAMVDRNAFCMFFRLKGRLSIVYT